MISIVTTGLIMCSHAGVRRSSLEAPLKNFIALVLVSGCTPLLAATYTAPAGSSAATIQAIVNVAGATPDNTVMFSAVITAGLPQQVSMLEPHGLHRAECGRRHPDQQADSGLEQCDTQ